MTTLTARRPAVRKPRTRKPAARSVRLDLAPCGEHPGILVLTVGRDRGDYYLTPLPSDFGLAYRLERFGTQSPDGPGSRAYDVCLYGAGGHHSCECLGFLRHGHCKHVGAMVALCDAGKLDAPPTPAARDDGGCDFGDVIANDDVVDPAEYESWARSRRCLSCGQTRDDCDCDAPADDGCDLSAL